ncbi:TonB-dependent receptor [Fodinibius salsisoli]|uniref:TonB-dependent receptor n=1 Tax=Fodinibius salsisoli TaxID=2820877 RepID=A0ABT3PMA5_9BACT|nr:TonB-dependent receptor [Fodinibius salsisoli]MCW9707077.1 TonB-dependent receptor [Fodinibius salsisoli]
MLLFKKLSFLAAILLFSQFANAQTGSIKGTVTDQETKEVIPGVNVGIENTTQGAATNAEGIFEITEVAPGNYTLVISAVGYAQKELMVSVNANQTTTADVALTKMYTELQEVEIIGRSEQSYETDVSYASTKVATRLKDVPQAISYVSKELIADKQAYRVNDVVENISGINQFSYYNDFTIRGFRSEQELINGKRVINLFGPQTLLANLERVEVIKGPASAVFGNASPGGTMNRVTKKPLADDRKAISFTTGSFNTLRSTLDFTGPLNEDKTLLYRLNVAYENSDSFRDLQQFNSLMIAPSISFLPTDKTRLNFDLVVTKYDGRLDRGQPIFGASAGTDLNSTPISFAIGAANDYHETDVVYGTLALNHEFTDNLSFNASYMRYGFQEDLLEHRTSNSFAVDSLGNEIPSLMGIRIGTRERERINDNVSTYFVWETNTGDVEHKIVAGYDFIQSIQPEGSAAAGSSSGAIYRTRDGGLAQYDPENPQNYYFGDNGNPVPNVPHFNLENPEYNLGFLSDYILQKRIYAPERYYTQGIYLQDQIKWNRLQLLLGVRQSFYTDVINYQQADESTELQQKFLPRLGVVYGITDQINLYGTYTESFQPQNPTDLQPENGGPFDPLEGQMIEFGAKGKFFQDRLSVNIAAYNINNKNKLVPVLGTDSLEQRGAEESKGIELDINGQVNRNLSLTANYAYNEAKITKSDDESLIGTIKENAPRHSGGFFANYAFYNNALNGLNINVGGNFVTERNTFEQTLQLPGYMVWDAGLSYKMNKVKVSFTLDNVFDKTHWVGGYSYVRLYPGTPRNYLMSVAYTF